MNKISVLIADPEQNNLNAFQAYFRRLEEYEIFTCLSADQLRSVMKKICINVLILDQKILDILGNNFLQIQKQNGITTIAITTLREVNDLEQAQKEKLLHSFFSKPFNTEDLHFALNEILNKNQAN